MARDYDFIVVGAGMVGAAIGFGLAGMNRRVLMLDGADTDFRAAKANFGLIWVQGKGFEHPAYQEEIEKGAAALRDGDASVKVKMLTSCPSCLQGMHRFANDAGGIEPDYIVVELAKHLLGENWLPDYVAKANSGGIERVLL